MTFKDDALDLNHYLLQTLENKDSLVNEDVQELCAVLNKYLLSDAFTLGIIPQTSLTLFTEKYSKGLQPDFTADFSKLLESLPELWLQESNLLKAQIETKKNKSHI